MEREIFLKLLTRKLTATISLAEEQQLEVATNAHPEFKQLEEELTQYFKTRQHQTMDVAHQLEKVWATIAVQELEPQTIKELKINHFNSLNLLKYAAAVLLLFIAGFAIRGFYQKTPVTQLLTLQSGNQKLFVTLADGTQVWLNQQSSISYNSDFGQTQRKIRLKGEAFFDVVKNAAVPLTVEAGHINIKVKGTAFNVKAIEPEKKLEVALIRGLIEVTDNDQSKSILLRPNHKLVFTAGADVGHAQMLAMNPIMENAIIEWTQDSLVFKKEKLKDLVLQMEIRYKVKIEIQNDQLKNKRFSGSFTDEPLKDALEALRLSYPFNYQITEQKVIIK